MSQNPNLKTIKTSNENNAYNALNTDFFGRNVIKILERLNHIRFYNTINVEKNSYEKKDKIKKGKTQLNLKISKLFNTNKTIMQEKEKKDLEKIYKKWEEPISSRLRKTNHINHIRKYDIKKFSISY